ncbi:MAG: 50S ribosomal protein L2 [Candidatus Riflebacteria bacterium]|nr:50S ribosomal protein L2 [Candidatus Riflebacteria bacterium]
MPLKHFKPTTPSRRAMEIVRKEAVTKQKPERSLLIAKKQRAGRNNAGIITSRARGGGNRKHIRMVDYRRDKPGVPARVAGIEYDPNRSAFLALLHYADGEKRYIVAPKDLKVGEVLLSSDTAEVAAGNALPLKSIPDGTMVHNVEIKPGKGGQFARSAGSFVQLMAKEGKMALLRMPSGELRKVPVDCKATIGQVGNLDHNLENWGKAGRTRWMGIRPLTRGMCRNPCDHPHGGGEGRSKGGNHPQSPWGQPAKGFRTRRRKKYSSRLIVRRREK